MRPRHLGNWIVLLLAVGVVLDAPSSRSAPKAFTVRAGHPRLLITPADIAPLRTRCLSDAAFTPTYAALKGRVDGWATPTTNRYVIGAQIQCLVLVALVESSNQAYLTKVDTWLQNLFVTQGAVALAQAGDAGSIWGSSEIILGTAMAYDWLYDRLTPAQRSQYGAWLRSFQQAVLNQQGGTTRDLSRSDYSNQFYYFDGMLAVSGLTLYNDGIDDASASAWVSSFDSNVHSHMIPVVNQSGGQRGGYHEGTGYVDRALTTLTLELEAWRVGAQEDLFPQASGLAGLGRWLVHATQPDGHVLNMGDVSGWPVGWSTDSARRSVLVAARYQDGYSQHVARTVTPSASSNWAYAPFYLLWYDPSVPPVDFASAATSEWFDGIGWVMMRDSWNPGATYASFTSGYYFFGHQHYDQNSFTIFRGAPLAIDNGVYNQGNPAYKTATRYHNTILVGPPGSETAVDDGASGQAGAQPMYYLANPTGTPSDRGRITQFDRGNGYTLAVGDASRAYSSSRLSSYVRKFLWIAPSTFVVLDRVVIPSTANPARWMLQSETAPAVSGGSYTVTNGSGRLFAQTLLPTAVQTTTTTLFSGVAAYGGGNFRLEVVSGSPQTEEYFLTAIEAADGTQAAMSPTQQVSSASGKLVGARVGGSVALLSKTGSPDAVENYAVASSSPLTHFVADLSPGMVYSVTLDGAPLTTTTTSPGGVLRFQSNTGGAFTLRAGTAPTDTTPPSATGDLRAP